MRLNYLTRIISHILATIFFLTNPVHDALAGTTIVPAHQKTSAWFLAGQKTIQQNMAHARVRGQAKNIILFIGDGMGVSTVTAARIYQGQLRGMMGEENILSWEKFANVALSKTYDTNQQVTDSAGAATAFMTGVKSKAGVISVDSSVTLSDCASAKGHHLESFLELAEQQGQATGIISTARLTHATPATAYAHVPERDWENDAEIPAAEKAAGCKDIAVQFLDFPYGDGIEVAFAGGRRNFLPKSVRGPEGKKGRRGDGRNLITEWQQKHPEGQYVWNEKGFDKIDPAKKGPILGLFNPSHMQYEADRAEDKGGEPSLSDMTAKAIKILQKKSKKGYFLYVEGGRIDHAHHMGNAYRALSDTDALAQAVQRAVDMTNPEDTLIIVTADHSHTFVLSGYPTRGNPILGKMVKNDRRGEPEDHFALADDGKPYTTLGYYSGPGAGIDHVRRDLSSVDTTAKDFRQQALIPLHYETHAGEDVAIYARGPSAWLMRGVVEENYIFHLMFHAAGMDAGLASGDDKK